MVGYAAIVCQYDRHSTASSARITHVIGSIRPDPAAPATASIASGPYAAEPRPSSPMAGIAANTPSLAPFASRLASLRPSRNDVIDITDLV